jgi:hypothetical protein
LAKERASPSNALQAHQQRDRRRRRPGGLGPVFVPAFGELGQQRVARILDGLDLREQQVEPVERA